MITSELSSKTVEEEICSIITWWPGNSRNVCLKYENDMEGMNLLFKSILWYIIGQNFLFYFKKHVFFHISIYTRWFLIKLYTQQDHMIFMRFWSWRKQGSGCASLKILQKIALKHEKTPLHSKLLQYSKKHLLSCAFEAGVNRVVDVFL